MLWWLRKQLLRFKLYTTENLANENQSLIIWYPVMFALGAWFYFAFAYRLSLFNIILYFELCLVLLFINRKKYATIKFLSYLFVFMLGLCLTKADAMYHEKKVEKESNGIIYLRGKVKNVDYNYNNRRRFHLTDVNNFDRDLKGDYRISATFSYEEISANDCVELVAEIMDDFTPNPLSNYNFERANLYKGLSGVGYSLGPVFKIDCPRSNGYISDWISTIRENIKTVVDENASDTSKGVVNALIIGDKSKISQEQTDNYRTAGLAHFLAISGMHMGMIALLVFFIVRALLFSYAQGRYDVRKLAAIFTIITTFFYFLISGQSVSCIRAFIMTSLMLIAILYNRRAISLRLWGVALLIVVVFMPYAVMTPGFMMSFVAVLGLVSFYEKYAYRINLWFKRRSLIGKISSYIVGLLIADLVASLMTIPYGIYYFNQISVYTSLGNLLAGPVIGFLVMPCLLLFVLSIPLGLESLTIKPLDYGINLINEITEWVSSLPYAKSGELVAVYSDWSIFVLTIGILWLCIWQSSWRKLGLIMIFIGLVGFYISPRPIFVYDAKGETFAYKNAQGKLVASKFHKNNYLEKMWTGTNLSGKYKDKEGDNITCDEISCTYQQNIKFGEGWLMVDGKSINLKDGGYLTK